MTFRIYLTGDKEVDRMLNRLTSGAARQASKQALRKGATIVLAAARRRVPLGRWPKKRHSTRWRDMLVVSAPRSWKSRGGSNKLGYVITTMPGYSYYASFVELGWRSGRRKSRAKGAEERDSRRKIPGKWYMRQAGNESEAQAVDVYRQSIVEFIQQEAAKK